MKKLILSLCLMLLWGCKTTPEITAKTEEMLKNDYNNVEIHSEIEELSIFGNKYNIPDRKWVVTTKEYFGEAGTGYILSAFDRGRVGDSMTVFVARPNSWIDQSYGNCSFRKLTGYGEKAENGRKSNSQRTFIEGDLLTTVGNKEGCWTLGYAGYFGSLPSSEWSQESRNAYGKKLMYSRVRGGDDVFTASHQVKELSNGYLLIVTYGRSVFVTDEYSTTEIYNGKVSSESEYIKQVLDSVYSFDQNVTPSITKRNIN
ncbi:hypothetical protein UB33_02400 [Photobacterium angustum]|uniref:hypothetical protein n=1 Tax=Photobacterium angustum TaxID=661 RepID=UPI0005E935B8|nr:hypothetical protein [Photobacterium angustum]KJG07778.1 hypothetical protein UB33_02400 [Photobacterium angustum]PSV94707.1 hypothetical protein CTN01_06575 [Photobacterium angustum]